MPTTFPVALDIYINKQDYIDYVLAAHINDPQDAIVATQAKVGITHDPNPLSLDYFRARPMDIRDTSDSVFSTGSVTGGLAEAIADLGGSPGMVFAGPHNHPIPASYAVPATVHLVVSRGATFTVANGQTLTINSTLEAGLYQIFAWVGTGVVVFGPNSVKEVYPQWWGAVGDGVADDTAEIQAALTAFYRIFFPYISSFYKITSPLIPPSGRHLIGGAGGVSAYIKIRNTSVGANQHCFDLTDKDRMTFEKLDIQGGSANTSDGIFAETDGTTVKWITVRDSRLHDCGRDGYHAEGTILTQMSNVETRDNGRIGVLIDAAGGGPNAGSASLYDVYAFQNGADGFYLGTTGADTLADSLIVRCYAEDNTRHGFWVGGNRLSFIKCVAESNDGDGFLDQRIGQGTYDNCLAIANALQGFNIDTTAAGTYTNCVATANLGNQWDLDVATVNQLLFNPVGVVVDNNGTNLQIFGSGLFRGKANFGYDSINLLQDITNVADPPTNAQLDAIFGVPPAPGRGFIATLDDASAEAQVYIVFASDNNWFWVKGTKAL